MNDGQQVAVRHFFFRIRHCNGHCIAVGELRVSGLIAEFIEARAQGVAARVLAQHQAPRGKSNFFGEDNFVGEGIFQDAVLVDTGFVREGVCACSALLGGTDTPVMEVSIRLVG